MNKQKMLYEPDAGNNDLDNGMLIPGRPLRVLHIGNIANNAYVNAKLLNEAGLDCDVMCYDYYHIQGCPEWDEAVFEGDFADQDFPAWWTKRLHGYRRPRWFAQGALPNCVRYLMARRQGRQAKAAVLWIALSMDRHLMSIRYYRENLALLWKFRQRVVNLVCAVETRLANFGRRFAGPAAIQRLVAVADTAQIGTGVLTRGLLFFFWGFRFFWLLPVDLLGMALKLLGRMARMPAPIAVVINANRLEGILGNVLASVGHLLLITWLFPVDILAMLAVAHQGGWPPLAQLNKALVGADIGRSPKVRAVLGWIYGALRKGVVVPMMQLKNHEGIGPGDQKPVPVATAATLSAAVPETDEVGDPVALRIDALIARFERLAYNRPDKLTREELYGAYTKSLIIGSLFDFYDVIVAYSTDSILPLVYGKRPYVAYEHGTIRDIPFEDSTMGRLAFLSYSQADAIYMTNADSQEQAQTLMPDPRRIVYGLHGFDERRILERIRAAGPGLKKEERFGLSDDIKLFFAPARQHWKHGFRSWLKGNDRIVRAARILTERHPGRFKVIFARWGREVDLTRQLIDEMGLQDHFQWTEPLNKTRLWLAYKASDAVMDQFVAPCIGGVTAEALAVGHCPVITHLDDEAMARFYGRTIPLFNCETPEQIAQAMEWILTDPQRCGQTVAACNGWMAECHSRHRVVETLLRSFQAAGVG